MQKPLVLLIVVLYGVLSVGVHIHLHYCCGKLSGINWMAQQADCCPSEENRDCAITHRCCSYTQMDFAIEDHHFPSSFDLSFVDFKTEAFTTVSPVLQSAPLSVRPNPKDLAVKRRLFLAYSSLIYYA